MPYITEHITCIDPKLWSALRLCWTCCEPLKTKRQQFFCSETCSDTFADNHYWSNASRAALQRARMTCARCGVQPGYYASYFGRRKRWFKDKGSRVRLEVNHIEPLVGAFRTSTCANHQHNLEVLCHDCHVEVTNEQRRARARRAIDRARAATGQAPLLPGDLAA